MRTRGGGDITISSSVDERNIRSDAVRQPFTSPTVQTGPPQPAVSGIDARALHYRQVAFKRQKQL